MSSLEESQEAPLPESPVMTQREAAEYPLPDSSGGTNPDEGSYTNPQDLPISMTPVVINDGNTKKKYFGNIDFITLAIFSLERPETVFIGGGAFGKTYRIKYTSNYYYVKSILIEKRKFFFPEDYISAINIVEREITINIDVTNKIPQHVSNIKAGYISVNDTGAQAYLIFEAPEGMVLSALIEILPPQINNYKYLRLYCMIKRAQNALNTLGYVHRDIKPDNIYVLTEGDIKNHGKILGCKLIDFGLTKKIGEVENLAGSPLYMPPDMIFNDAARKELKIPFSTRLYRGPVIKRRNDYSVDVIWKKIFRMGNAPVPDCESADMAGGGRCRKKSRKCKPRKSKTRKSRSS